MGKAKFLTTVAFSVVASNAAFAACSQIPLNILDAASHTTAMSSGTSADGNCKTYIDADPSGTLMGGINAPVPGKAANVEPATVSNGSTVPGMTDLVGKFVFSPFAPRELMVRGAASTIVTTAVTLFVAAGASVKNYITDIECFRTDASTTAAFVTFSDNATTSLPLPGTNGAFMKTFSVPLVTAANATFSFSVSTAISTAFCSAQGFTGY